MHIKQGHLLKKSYKNVEFQESQHDPLFEYYFDMHMVFRLQCDQFIRYPNNFSYIPTKDNRSRGNE